MHFDTMNSIDTATRRLFSEARSYNHWLSTPVPESLLRAVHDLAQMGPTSMNSQPMRLQFVVSEPARQRLLPCVKPANAGKIREAPAVAIIGMDMRFHDRLPTLYPHNLEAHSLYEGKPEFLASTALRNSSLQGAYLIMAARLLGLDCGPMSGFDAQAVDQAFWSGTTVRTNFLCNLGYADHAQIRPRGPRLAFDEICTVL